MGKMEFIKVIKNILHSFRPNREAMNPFSRHLLAITVLICLSQASCAYRFSNSYIEPPEGIESIAVEAIYDTSREVISHEQLWQQVQEAVIKDGHLQLKDRSEADALLRLHIMDANIAPAGESRQNGPNPDGKDPEVYGRNYPPHPNKMRPLTQAGQFKDSAQMRFVVLAEVVNLRTRAILHKKKYNVTLIAITPPIKEIPKITGF